MGKSSTSLKKKHSKSSSKSKRSGKSKSRKSKSKKVRRREVSLSSSDYDDSKSMDTSVSSSSVDRSRRKSDRSRSRKDVKIHKRARRRSCSSDSSEDSVVVKKRKQVKRKDKYEETKEESRRKKKVRREASVSSTRSGSRRSPTYHSGIDNSDNSELENSRGRTERKEKGKRSRGRSGSAKSSRYRARSCSSCSSPRGESSYEQTEDKYVSQNKSRWLRSVIIVAKAEDESRELSGADTKEEIVDDLDYPCRSNDSNDGGTKTDLDHDTHHAPEEELKTVNELRDMNADVNFAEPELGVYGAGTSESGKEETNDASGANLNDIDLESILRQRALENLRMFRGQSTSKASELKNKTVSQVKQQITNKEELDQDKSNVSDVAIATKFGKQTPVEATSLTVVKRHLAAYPRSNGRNLNKDKDISGSAKIQIGVAPEKLIDAHDHSKVVTEPTNNKTGNLESTPSESCHDSLQSDVSLKQTIVSRLSHEKLILRESNENKDTFEAAHVISHHSNDNVPSAGPKPSINGRKFNYTNLVKEKDKASDHSQFQSKQTSDLRKPSNSNAKLPRSEADEERNATKTTQSSIQNTNSSGRDVDESCNAAAVETGLKSSSAENNSGIVQNESNQGSQFEQKTMTVMRGGELVQVSYKVYIPKKTPALARRQLKR